jgi:pantoate--beta-alanine ligase
MFNNLNEWIRFRKTLSSDSSLGFVPTMGNLHAGHASLFLKSREKNARTVSSLFVNPTQFNNPNDLALYPRTLKADIQIMENAGVDFCILPDEKAMYADAYRYQVQEKQLAMCLEGKHRPGHFDGVLTVVLKLLHLTKPTRAYFGEKDYQQFLLIQSMVDAFFMDIEIKACPTIREQSGLAFSSRNNRLTSEQRLTADAFAKLFHQDKSCSLIHDELTTLGIRVDYLEEYEGRRYAAVSIGDVRLIDNYQVV